MFYQSSASLEYQFRDEQQTDNITLVPNAEVSSPLIINNTQQLLICSAASFLYWL